MRQRWQDWEDRVLDELREFTNGSVTTIGRLMETVSGGEAALSDEEIGKLLRELEADANACGIILDRRVGANPGSNRESRPVGEDSSSGSEASVYEREFAVYNGTAGVKCPRCGGTNTPRIMPKEAAQQEISRKCGDCGKTFGGRPLIAPKNSSRANGPGKIVRESGAETDSPEIGRPEDYWDAVVSIEFVMREIFGGCTKILIRKNAEGALVKVSEGEPGEAVGSRQITGEEWDRILHTLYRRFYLADWNKGYDSFLPDGPRWELRLKLSGRRQRNYHGSRELTPYFKDLMNLMIGVF